MDYEEFRGKNVEDAITEACTRFTVTSDRLDYEIIDKGSSGFLGINSHPAVIKARPVEKSEDTEKAEKAEKKETVKADNEKKSNIKESGLIGEGQRKAPEKESKISDKDKEEIIKRADDFLTGVFGAMGIEVTQSIKFDENDGSSLSIELKGSDMGVLIGKRGQTLDSLQYLTSLVVNKSKSGYIRVKVDTEDYRERRRKTLENLAKNLSYKVKRTRKPVTLEPMNPYERRIIHSMLQNDKFVTTHSEGEEPYRRVVITLKH